MPKGRRCELLYTLEKSTKLGWSERHAITRTEALEYSKRHKQDLTKLEKKVCRLGGAWGFGPRFTRGGDLIVQKVRR